MLSAATELLRLGPATRWRNGSFGAICESDNAGYRTLGGAKVSSQQQRDQVCAVAADENRQTRGRVERAEHRDLPHLFRRQLDVISSAQVERQSERRVEISGARQRAFARQRARRRSPRPSSQGD